MWLSKAADSLNKLVHPAARALHSAGVSILALMMLLTASDVTLRCAFNRPIIGSFDLTEYMMAIVVSFGLAYCALLRGHVRVDLIVSHLPKRFQAIIDSITGLLGVILFSVITWQNFIYMELLFDSGVKSTVLLVPRFPFAGLVFLGSAFLTIVLLAHFLEFLSEAVRK
jgi:TRAP-type C4-dicarboxylate transport system permease small subunit